MTATKSTWEKPIQKCQPTGTSPLKSTLQKVTYKTKNIKSGNISSKIGAKKTDALSNAGIKAKKKYIIAPVAIATGNVQSFIK